MAMTDTTTAIDPGEREAARIALEGSALQRARLAITSLRKLLRDPDDTRQVFYLGLASSYASYPRFLARFLSTDEGARLLRERPGIDSAHVDFDALRALPADTLGGAYVRFLDTHGLDPDLFQAPPGLPEVPAYISQRLRQVHDLWHVLTGYPTDVEGEIALQAFSWAQSQMPAPAMITLGGLARFGWREPRYVGRAIGGYRRGRRARFLGSVRFEDHFTRKLDDVRAELGIEPYRPH